MNVETTIITKSKDYFLVENIEDILIKVRKKHVKQIMDKVKGVDKKEIIILLAVIKQSRMIVGSSGGIANEKLNKDVAYTALGYLLNVYPAEVLIDLFEDIKFFQIKEILESDYPVEAIRNYI